MILAPTPRVHVGPWVKMQVFTQFIIYAAVSFTKAWYCKHRPPASHPDRTSGEKRNYG